MPDVIPTHYNMNYVPDAWHNKSLGFVLMFPIINLLISAFMWSMGVLFEKTKLQIDPNNPLLSFAQHRMYRRKMGHCLGLLSLSIAITFVLIGIPTVWLELGGPIWTWMPFLPWIVPCVVLCVVAIRAGQGGCKLKPKFTEIQISDEETQRLSTGRGDDKHWALGMFYHNPDDPAYVVEDRFGNGIGFNFSRLFVKIGMVLTLLAITVTYVWITVWLYPIL